MTVAFGNITLDIKIFSNLTYHEKEDEVIKEANVLESISEDYFNTTWFNDSGL